LAKSIKIKDVPRLWENQIWANMELSKGVGQFYSAGRENFLKEHATLLRRIFVGGDLKSNKMKGCKKL